MNLNRHYEKQKQRKKRGASEKFRKRKNQLKGESPQRKEEPQTDQELFRQNKNRSLKERFYQVGVLGVEPRSQDPQPCIMAVIRHPVKDK
ncbi:MAG: hypothetical protein PHI77_02680 [Candidatus Pacebacteria bacterium]|nr:hypothetical protein [Candidatus Paceibacterota bacterium]MDD4875278.1 hypothetical protein [Candidatus Paceibacterota bacterium]